LILHTVITDEISGFDFGLRNITLACLRSHIATRFQFISENELFAFTSEAVLVLYENLVIT